MNRITLPTGIELRATEIPGQAEILSHDAVQFIAELHRKFASPLQELLEKRKGLTEQLSPQWQSQYLPETQSVRDGRWSVAPTPDDLQDRRVEITGPVEAKMMINALNSGARVFMADFEDANSPTWRNNIEGQKNLFLAVRRTLAFTSPDGKEYRLKKDPAVLMVRPRGLHLVEKHLLVDGQSIPAPLFDFGLYLFHNGQELVNRGSGPYFYLPKLESYLEARWWNDVISFAQEKLALPIGTVKVTVLIETILASLQMDEILYELRDHITGLNAGRWDYIFSAIKKFRDKPGFVFPDRTAITMKVPFMQAYCKALVQTCHRRNAHAMGGMSAFIPSRKDQEINALAISKITEDKLRESADGFDGTWVAHPDLVAVAKKVFDEALGDKPNQKGLVPHKDPVPAAQLTDFSIPDAHVTEAGVRDNIVVALLYLDSWLAGNGAVAIFNLMEDAATAEISRSQLWQWVHRRAYLDSGQTVTPSLFKTWLEEETRRTGELLQGRYDQQRMERAVGLLENLVLSPDFSDFLTVPAYEYLD